MLLKILFAKALCFFMIVLTNDIVIYPLRDLLEVVVPDLEEARVTPNSDPRPAEHVCKDQVLGQYLVYV